jgi:hypothetical protein
MKLEYLDATGNGANPNASPAYLIRLSEFTDQEKQNLIKDIQETVIVKQQPLPLHQLNYIQPINCSVTLQLSEKGESLVENGSTNTFTYLLSAASFQGMIEIIKQVEEGYNWLTPAEYLDDPAFLISKFGTW